MIDFYLPGSQVRVLGEALGLAGYDAVMHGTLAAIGADLGASAVQQANIRAMAYHIRGLGEGAPPDAGLVLRRIATSTWGEIGVSDPDVPALSTEERGAIIGIVMGVCKDILAEEVDRLQVLAGADTSLPEGWLGDEPVSA